MEFEKIARALIDTDDRGEEYIRTVELEIKSPIKVFGKSLDVKARTREDPDELPESLQEIERELETSVEEEIIRLTTLEKSLTERGFSLCWAYYTSDC